LILGFTALAPLALMLVWRRSPLAGIGIVWLSHMFVLYPTLRPNVQWLGPVVTRFATTRKELWLTIDDGPTDDTTELLDLFDAHSVKATFFIKGTLAEQHPERVREMLERGHSVANHTQTHPSGSFWCLLPGRIASEIDDCNRVLERITGHAPRWFRAPVGMKNPFVHPALARRHLRLIGWSARGFDGVVGDPEQIVARIVPKLTPGAIIVLHQGRERSRVVLERTIAAAKERGYEFVIPADEQLRCV
jgi:peptidoglycan/xylan/chitin deacetylase (PgdA/CDA1 family)